jgi:tRNA (cmo5U34)-methyltransferase
MLQVADKPEFIIPTNWTFEDQAVAAGFERHVRETLPWYELATGAVAHVARHYIPLDGLVYDLGCATGNIGRALAPTLQARKAHLIAVEPSHEMAAIYTGPPESELLIERAECVEFQPFDVAVAFLTIMFVAVAERARLLDRLFAAMRPGGVLIVFDKCEADTGYAATVLWRLALAGKLATGIDPAEIVAKELSLSGVQRPLSRGVLPAHALEFFRFGEFAGWLIEKEIPRCRQDP